MSIDQVCYRDGEIVLVGDIVTMDHLRGRIINVYQPGSKDATAINQAEQGGAMFEEEIHNEVYFVEPWNPRHEVTFLMRGQ